MFAEESGVKRWQAEWVGRGVDLSLWDCIRRGDGREVSRAGPKTRPVYCGVQTPGGARVASPQSPILRWSKGSGVSRFRFPGGL